MKRVSINRFSRMRKSFREGAHQVGDLVRQEVGHGLRRVRKTPRWLRILTTVYHDYGLKHVMLILLLVLYQFLGAAVFYYTEAGFDEDKERHWVEVIAANRTTFVADLFPLMFNNTQYLFFLTHDQSIEVATKISREVQRYEKQLGIKYTDQKIKWDFWNAMLYAQTICTTIGYGHLYPSTNFGRVFTMIYAIFGIPLVLSILDDLGKLLTKGLKGPWWLVKCACRRAFKYCTKQTIEEIRRLDDEDKKDLEIFDLPIPIAIFVVMAWIFVCSATFCIWEQEWDYFLAFYFFFISLSTIGLGDITPTQPKYLLMLFIYIIIGLSLVSMCINLIQAKLERTYDAGRQCQLPGGEVDRPGGLLLDMGRVRGERIVRRRGSSLGVFRTSSSVHSLNKEILQQALTKKPLECKSSQTLLSFPSSSSTNAQLCRSVSASSRLRLIPRTLSIDDVMKLVDTEEGDILVLTELVREESGISALSTNSTSSSSGPIVISKSFDVFGPASSTLKASTSDQGNHPTTITIPPGSSRPILPSHPSLHDLEALEELEDRILLGNAVQQLSTVQFRSRLSLIPEQHSQMEEAGDSSESVATSMEFPSPPNKRRESGRRSLIGLLRRKHERSGDERERQPALEKT